MSENKNIVPIQKSREVLLNILTRRGYDTSEYTGFSLTELHALFMTNQLDILLENPTNNKKSYIKYYLEKNIKPANVYEFIEDIFNIEQILKLEDDLIIIIKDEPNDTLQKLQSTILVHDKIFVTIINIARLQFNILDHILVPDHKVLLPDDLNAVKERYQIIDNTAFPTISRFDPVAQVLGVRPGEVCEIERTSKTAITTKNYRICSQ